MLRMAHACKIDFSKIIYSNVNSRTAMTLITQLVSHDIFN